MENKLVELLNYFKNVMRKISQEEINIAEDSKPKPIKLLNYKEVMVKLGISESTFRRYVRSGTISAIKVNGHIRVSEEVISNLLKDVKSLKYKRE